MVTIREPARAHHVYPNGGRISGRQASSPKQTTLEYAALVRAFTTRMRRNIGTLVMEYPYARNTYWQITAKDEPLRENREPVAAQADANTPAAEEWAIPTSQREEGTPQQPTSGLEILATTQSQETVMVTENVTDVETTEPAPAEATPAQQPIYALEDMHGEFDIPDADEGLANLANVTVYWPNDPGTVGSAPTSMATNTQTARGNIYKACRCPEHQEIYDNWPARHADLTIAH
ncbi:hypothetical protein TRV_07962 [Trichophyton verrucosum HKI 0517]|uniref:Uncharacterized protein n=1 Tax=Trichophyton verrucosum (strain HKI 0517) TaxID=663202 RepID=D4DL88_TRIVH|nr:uncharacterized protein TRV_07962 [Trichophyton verrucosum HKI 0517]EFE37393.1 hypothetical protein TRV_07962 [Trichophyton verrucosum HKI 0517]